MILNFSFKFCAIYLLRNRLFYLSQFNFNKWRGSFMKCYKKTQRNEYGQLQGEDVNHVDTISVSEVCLQGDTVALHAISHINHLKQWEVKFGTQYVQNLI